MPQILNESCGHINHHRDAIPEKRRFVCSEEAVMVVKSSIELKGYIVNWPDTVNAHDPLPAHPMYELELPNAMR